MGCGEKGRRFECIRDFDVKVENTVEKWMEWAIGQAGCFGTGKVLLAHRESGSRVFSGKYLQEVAEWCFECVRDLSVKRKTLLKSGWNRVRFLGPPR